LLYLERFNFVLYYYSGKSIDKPDILFQRPHYDNGSHENENVVLIKLEYLVVYVIEELVFKREKYSFLVNIYQSNRVGQ